MTDDPLMTLPEIAAYTASSETYVRRHMNLAETNPARLPSVLHAGKKKARRSWVNAWIDATAA